jgi:hypothetical protein
MKSEDERESHNVAAMKRSLRPLEKHDSVKGMASMLASSLDDMRQGRPISPVGRGHKKYVNKWLWFVMCMVERRIHDAFSQKFSLRRICVLRGKQLASTGDMMWLPTKVRLCIDVLHSVCCSYSRFVVLHIISTGPVQLVIKIASRSFRDHSSAV